MAFQRPPRFPRIALRPSRILALALALGYLAAMVVLLRALSADVWAWLGCAALGAHGGYVIVRYAALRHPGAVVALELLAGDRCIVSNPSGRTYECRVQANSCILGWLVVLNLACTGQRWRTSIVALPDSATQAHLRRLRTWLRWSASAAAAPSVRSRSL